MRTTLVLILLLALAGCAGNGASATDAGLDGGTDTGDPVPLTAVDMLIVVDDTWNSAITNPILAENLFAFASALLHPLPGSPYGAIDDLRIAAATPNMGLSANGESMDEIWPWEVGGACSGLGDNGAFQGVWAYSIDLPNDALPCDVSGAQCPPGWTCAMDGDAGADGVGRCHTDGATEVECPALPTPWAETADDAPNAGFAVQAGCLARQRNAAEWSSSVCGWEQPLQGAAIALTRPDQAEFVRDDAVLALLFVTNQEDCSLGDGPGFIADFEEMDIDLEIVCAAHPEVLIPASQLYQAYVDARGRADAVVSLSIVGVPYAGQDGAAACEGAGDELGDCLAQASMQLGEVGDGGVDYRLACDRYEGENMVAHAWPSRRFVELANGSFGADSYVYSICNADWTPAFDALAAMIAGKLEP
jgi:hypothetical protein